MAYRNENLTLKTVNIVFHFMKQLIKGKTRLISSIKNTAVQKYNDDYVLFGAEYHQQKTFMLSQNIRFSTPTV